MPFAASIAEPPPRAMMQSGSKSRIHWAPLNTVVEVGLGSTSEKIVQATSSRRCLRWSISTST